MKLLFILHFYQPYNQQVDILERIVNESYRPLVKGLLNNKKHRVVVNISGALLSLLSDRGYSDVIDGLKTLALRHQIEFTGSSMYHAFLPLLPGNEVERQIDLNSSISIQYFGEGFMPSGFFPPEMAISPELLSIVSSKGYKWIATPEMALDRNKYTADPAANMYEDSHSGIKLFFRNKRVSSLVLSSIVKSAQELITETQDIAETDKYWVCVMDAETFGHHRIGHDEVLFDILSHPFFDPCLSEDILALPLPTHACDVRSSTWTNQEQDFWLTSNNSFVLWKDPENPIHKMQWEFTDFAIKTVADCDDISGKCVEAHELLDKALASDQYWWASAKPWWSLEMIETGAFDLRQVIKLASTDAAILEKAESYYRGILDLAFFWQRSGHIRKKHLANSSTYLKEPFVVRTPAEWYNQVILEFEDEMNLASRNGNFEKAIKWRDAIIKLNNRTDIYDILHVVDELWTVRNIPQVKPFLEYDWQEFSEFAKKNFISCGSREEFERWKKERGFALPL
ncbi:UvrB/UvrC motif-containing protein [Patescibacteria group bacterium]|nr:UvrB/UvrC motif-containing protein [Patescibacteria group bacterium]